VQRHELLRQKQIAELGSVDSPPCAMIKRAWDRGVPVWVLMLAVLGGVAIFDSIFLRRSLPLSEPSGEAPDAAPPAVERETAPAVWYEKPTAGEQRATGGTLDWGALERLGDLREAAAETRARPRDSSARAEAPNTFLAPADARKPPSQKVLAEIAARRQAALDERRDAKIAAKLEAKPPSEKRLAIASEDKRRHAKIAKALEAKPSRLPRPAAFNSEPARAAPLAGRTPTAPVPSDDAAWATALKPMWGFEHDPRADVVMALGFGYARTEFARFVSTLRATGYAGDVVLAAGPPEKFRNGVEDYLKGEGVLAYQFTYECYKKKRGGRRLLATPAGCVLTNWYAGGDARGPRPLAVARYEMYRAWLANYDEASWAFVFDFRDVFFQRDPFPLVDRSPSAPNLHLFAENRDVKTVGTCRFNSGWLNCWDPTLKTVYHNASVMCSGSTLGSVPAMKRYAERMLAEMDRMACWATKAATESDQGYHNFLYHTGALAALPGVRVAHHEQGRGLVNTIGAMNGFRVPAHKKGPLDTFWKIKDADGYILDWDGQYSAVVHQWDRFGKEVVGHIDRLARAYAKAKRGAEGEDGATATGRGDMRFATARDAAPGRGDVPRERGALRDDRKKRYGRGRGRRGDLPPRREGDAF
jgi:hypothetical protein